MIRTRSNRFVCVELLAQELGWGIGALPCSSLGLLLGTLLSLTKCGRNDVEKTSVVKKAISFRMVKIDFDLLYSL